MEVLKPKIPVVDNFPSTGGVQGADDANSSDVATCKSYNKAF